MDFKSRDEVKTRLWTTIAIMVCLTLTVSACGPEDVATDNPELRPGEQDTVAATEALVPEFPTATSNAFIANELRQDDILNLVRASLSAFPWRLQQNVLVKQTGQAQTSLTEVQSSTRGYNRSVQTVGSEPITIESILIDSPLYLRITGSPAESYGLVAGQWTEIPPGSPLAQLADTSAVDPARIAEIFAADFATVSGQGGVDELRFELVGSEDMDGTATNIYEAKGTSFTYRWWIGTDGRFYKTVVDIPTATRTIVMEYDSSISIQPPSP